MREQNLCALEIQWRFLRKHFINFLLPLIIPGLAFADNAPEMVIYRDVPQHDAFRTGDKGQATAIATARPDLVTGSAKQTSAAPEGLSDAMLRMVGGTGGVATGNSLDGQSTAGAAIASGTLGGMSGNAGAALSTGSAMAPASAIGSAISHGMAPLGAALQALPGMK